MNDLGNPVESADPSGRALSALDAGDYWEARAYIRAAMAGGRLSAARQRSLAGRIAQLEANTAGLIHRRIFVLSTFSSEFLHEPLVVAGFAKGVLVTVRGGRFGAFRQDILEDSSELYSFQPDTLVLALMGEDVCPTAYLVPDPVGPLNDLLNEITGLLETFRGRSDADILIHNLVPPIFPAFGTGDGTLAPGQRVAVQRFNHSLADAARRIGGVYVVDCEGLVARYGGVGWADERMRHYARLPLGRSALMFLANEWARLLRVLTGGAKKCLVLDLDNTCWGGILGEDGPAGIQLDAVYPGSAYKAFQVWVRELGARGILLAIASKNDPAEVAEVFANHPHMVLKPEHFAAMEIGWGPKSESVKNIAARLSIGLEHIVFVDDNPAELAEVRQSLPMVEAVCFPRQAEQFESLIAAEGWFDAVTFSEEDRDRTKLYQRRAEAELLREQAESGANVETFYRSLEMEIAIERVSAASLPRTAQLVNKTNQLNLTTRRYSESDLASRMEDPAWVILTTRVTDRYGDNGIVGVAMARTLGETLDIDNLLLSCRVIGRGVESAMLAALCDVAIARGHSRMTATMIQTPKNVPARNILPDAGFKPLDPIDVAKSRWEIDVSRNRIEWPTWFCIRARP